MVLHSRPTGTSSAQTVVSLERHMVVLDRLAAEDSVQAVETIPKGEASSAWQLFPSFDSGNDVKLLSVGV